jgi:hypothetical protein
MFDAKAPMISPGDSFTHFKSSVDITRTVEGFEGMYVVFSVTYSDPSHSCKNMARQKLSIETFMNWANKADRTTKANEK